MEIEKLNSLVISQRETLKAKNREMQLMSKAWHLPWSDIELLQKLDRGAFGEVWRATYRENWDVAVKKMFRTCELEREARECFHCITTHSLIHIKRKSLEHPPSEHILEYQHCNTFSNIKQVQTKSKRWTTRVKFIFFNVFVILDLWCLSVQVVWMMTICFSYWNLWRKDPCVRLSMRMAKNFHGYQEYEYF